jgi:hypothetical protein
VGVGERKRKSLFESDGRVGWGGRVETFRWALEGFRRVDMPGEGKGWGGVDGGGSLLRKSGNGRRRRL